MAHLGHAIAGLQTVRCAHISMPWREGIAISCSAAVAGGRLCIAAETLLQLQLGCMHGLLLPQVRLNAPFMPLAHAAMADKDVKDHHQHLQAQALK